MSALVLGDRPTDLEQEVIVRGVAHRLVEELDRRAGALQFFEQEHLVDVVAGEAVGGGDEDAVVVIESHLIAQAVEGGAVEGSAAAPLVTEDVFVSHSLAA
jgi:hypothetical protein